MTSKYAKTIHPYRTSGTNRPGYSLPPVPPQQPVDDYDERPRHHRVELGQPRAQKSVEEIANGLAGRVSLVAPKVEAEEHEHFVSVRLDGYTIRIKESAEIAFAHGRFGVQLLVRPNPIARIVVLVVRPGVGILEMRGLPLDIIQEMTERYFGN